MWPVSTKEFLLQKKCTNAPPPAPPFNLLTKNSPKNANH